MNRLAQRKTRLIFETEDCVFERSQNRHIIIEARPAHCCLRLKGGRKRFAVGYAEIYQYAIELAEKREARRRKKGGAR
ncbi:MAG TPA: hypothetical protein VGR47_05820 [Terracidiphilus sp.]|nr:hypothetical protein [Terracidiphilus sp.]